MRKSLQRGPHAARKHFVLGRIAPFLVLIGLFLGVIAMPAMAHVGTYGPVHASEMLDVHEVDDADHQHSQGSDKDMPCHAVSHHHCSIALQLEAPRIKLNGLAKDTLVRPAATTPLTSRSQAPPVQPPSA